MSSTFSIQFQSPKKNWIRKSKKADWAKNVREDYRRKIDPPYLETVS
jgi:hypothetical protein